MAEEPPSKRAKSSSSTAEEAAGEEEAAAANPWRHSCSDVMSFHLLNGTSEQELEAEIASGGTQFDCDFFHQHFGDDEVINGYKGLSVKVWLSARTYHVWVDVSFKTRKMGCDQIMKIFNEHFPLGVQKNKADFISAVVSSCFTLANITTQGVLRETLTPAGQDPVIIQQYTLSKAPKEVQDLHARFEPLLLFFIDGASLVEKGDDKWDVLLALQTREGGPALLGMATLYNFWAYPDTCRLRLSQILVLPPFRDMGLGKALVAVAYRIARERNCVDLTLEDPTPNLQRVREKLEVEELLATPWVTAQTAACASAVMSGQHEWPQQPMPAPPAPPPSQAPISDGGSTACNAGLTAGSGTTSQPLALRQPSVRGESASPSSNVNNSVQAGSSTGAAQAGAAKAGVAGAGARRGPEGPLACIVPPAAFLTAITQHLKIYSKEARVVWEALLFLEPGLWEQPAGRAALTALVQNRIEAAAFAHTKADAERKQLVPLGGASAKKQGFNFIMMRAVVPEPEGEAAGSAAPAAGDGSVATGRLSVTTMSAEEKEEKLNELCEERWQQLKTLKSLMARKATCMTA